MVRYRSPEHSRVFEMSKYQVGVLVWVGLFLLVAARKHRHVIQLTDNLRARGFTGDIDLGEVVDEQVVTSDEACRVLCRDSPVCRGAILVGQLCRMFSGGLPKCKVSEM